jgi:hypothetical protein
MKIIEADLVVLCNDLATALQIYGSICISTEPKKLIVLLTYAQDTKCFFNYFKQICTEKFYFKFFKLR